MVPVTNEDDFYVSKGRRSLDNLANEFVAFENNDGEKLKSL